MYEERDLSHGQQMVECFKPFLRHLVSSGPSRKTLRSHRDNLWILGGEIISKLHEDPRLRKRPTDQIVLAVLDDEGGPLISHGSEDQQRSFDSTCRKFFRFLTDPEIATASAIDAIPRRRTDRVIDGTNAERPAMRVAVKPRSRAAVRRRRRA